MVEALQERVGMIHPLENGEHRIYLIQNQSDPLYSNVTPIHLESLVRRISCASDVGSDPTTDDPTQRIRNLNVAMN
jgi:hypothetical protein